MSKRTRQLVRLVHFAGAAVLGTFVYSPWSSDPTFTSAVRWLAFPLLSASGLFLWRGHLLLRAARRGR